MSELTIKSEGVVFSDGHRAAIRRSPLGPWRLRDGSRCWIELGVSCADRLDERMELVKEHFGLVRVEGAN